MLDILDSFYRFFSVSQGFHIGTLPWIPFLFHVVESWILTFNEVGEALAVVLVFFIDLLR